ncbi:hypothetical protein BJV78DRAFT_1282236 [Lactifluus subvellereus]|nr:hypothetical protein BJV78DRAFT_1282236 [Lactifluus subvellereus]
MQPHHNSSNRRAYGTRALEFCIQTLVITMIGFGWYTSLLEVGVGWLVRHEERYIAAGRATHSVPIYAAPEPQSLTEPYECRSDGSFNFCVKDNCKMRWKPPALLVLTSVTVPLASLPILPMLRAHVVSALAVSHADAWATDVWWDRPYSWILCGGPPGRWVVGTLLGLRTLRAQRGPDSRCNLVMDIAISMTIVVAVDVTRGQESVRRFAMIWTGKTARISADRFVCIPYSNRLGFSASASAVHVIPTTQWNSPESWEGQCIYPIPTKVRIYDLGWRENWRRVLAQSLFDDGTPCRGVYKWPKFNPEMMRRMLGTKNLWDTTQRNERKSHSTFS